MSVMASPRTCGDLLQKTQETNSQTYILKKNDNDSSGNFTLWLRAKDD